MINKFKDFFYFNRVVIQEFTLFLLFITLVFLPAFNSYFQQDEWFYMAYYNKFQGFFWPINAFLAPFKDLQTFSFHLTPLGSFLYGLELKMFWINYKYYLILSIFIQSFNCFLIYKFITEISRSRFVGFISSIFFASSSSILEATFWVGAHIQVQLALTFYLISLVFLTKASSQKSTKKYFFSLLFYFLSILTKETVSLLFVTYPIVALIINLKSNKMRIRNFYFIFASYIVFRLSYPVIFKFFTKQELYSSIINHSTDPLFIIYFTISLFLKALSQIFFGGIDFTAISESITDLAYSQYASQKSVRGIDYLTFTQSAAHDITLFLFSIPVILLISVIFMRFYFVNFRHFLILLLGAIIFLSGVLPLTILSSWLMTFFAYISSIESRQLYISALGGSIFVGFGTLWLKNIGDIFKIKKYKIGWIVALAFVFIWVFWQIRYVHRQINKYSIYANDRKEIVKIWLGEKPKLGKKTLFYSESNVALYGFADYMLPFQNNPGQVILSIYAKQQKMPDQFLTTKSLSKGLTEQWYEEHDGIGIGYFLKKKDLIRAIIEHKINLDDVISIKYDGKEHEVLNFSQDIRSELRGLFDKRNEIKNWKLYKNNKFAMQFYYPSSLALEENKGKGELLSITLTDPQTSRLFISISIYSKKEEEGVSDKSILLTGNKEFYVKSLAIGPTDNYTAISFDQIDYESSYFNTITNKELKVIKRLKNEILNQEEIKIMDNIVSTLEFYN